LNPTQKGKMTNSEWCPLVTASKHLSISSWYLQKELPPIIHKNQNWTGNFSMSVIPWIFKQQTWNFMQTSDKTKTRHFLFTSESHQLHKPETSMHYIASSTKGDIEYQLQFIHIPDVLIPGSSVLPGELPHQTFKRSSRQAQSQVTQQQFGEFNLCLYFAITSTLSHITEIQCFVLKVHKDTLWLDCISYLTNT
jgi:hypothetical protein